MASSCLWLQTFRLAVPCRHSTGWTGGPQRAAILGRRGLEPQFSDSVASIYLYATRPRLGAGLSRLSPLRVGCLRLAPIGTRFCFLLVLYPRKPVQLVLRMSTGSGADGWTRTDDIPPGAVLYRLSYVCIDPPAGIQPEIPGAFAAASPAQLLLTGRSLRCYIRGVMVIILTVSNTFFKNFGKFPIRT